MSAIEDGIRKVLVDTDLVGARIWRIGHVPEKVTFPYFVIQPWIADVAVLKGDARTIGKERAATVDVYQRLKAEDEAIIRGVVDALDGVRLTVDTDDEAIAERVLRLRVTSSLAIPEPSAGVQHHAVDVAVAYLA